MTCCALSATGSVLSGGVWKQLRFGQAGLPQQPAQRPAPGGFFGLSVPPTVIMLRPVDSGESVVRSAVASAPGPGRTALNGPSPALFIAQKITTKSGWRQTNSSTVRAVALNV